MSYVILNFVIFALLILQNKETNFFFWIIHICHERPKSNILNTMSHSGKIYGTFDKIQEIQT